MADYRKEEITHMVDIMFRAGNLSELYNQEFVNYFGNTIDTNDAYIEVIAEYLIQRFDSFNSYFKHSTITRKASYRNMRHNKEWPDFVPKTPKNDEFRIEKIAKCLFIESDWDDAIGKMLDYQIQLKDTSESEIIDLASYSESENKIRVFGVQAETSEDTILRCLLKTYTYAKILDFQKLQSDFKIVSNPKLVASLIVYKDSPIVGQKELPCIKDLIVSLDLPIELYTWDYDESKERKFIISKI